MEEIDYSELKKKKKSTLHGISSFRLTFAVGWMFETDAQLTCEILEIQQFQK